MIQRKVQHILRVFIERKLASRKRLQYEDYQRGLNVYDLTLLDFVKHYSANDINDKIDVDKESRVCNALSKTLRVIKFHCQTPIDFKLFRRLLYQLMYCTPFLQLHAAIIAAAHESQIVAMFHPIVSVPKPAFLGMNVLVMELAPGQLLNKIIFFNPEKFVSMISEKEAWRASWQDIAHADLNEFNIIPTKGGQRIINWPQNVGYIHLNAIQFLERSLSRVFSFFAEKYKISIPIEKAESLVRLPLEVV